MQITKIIFLIINKHIIYGLKYEYENLNIYFYHLKLIKEDKKDLSLIKPEKKKIK